MGWSVDARLRAAGSGQGCGGDCQFVVVAPITAMRSPLAFPVVAPTVQRLYFSINVVMETRRLLLVVSEVGNAADSSIYEMQDRHTLKTLASNGQHVHAVTQLLVA